MSGLRGAAKYMHPRKLTLLSALGVATASRGADSTTVLLDVRKIAMARSARPRARACTLEISSYRAPIGANRSGSPHGPAAAPTVRSYAVPSK